MVRLPDRWIVAKAIRSGYEKRTGRRSRPHTFRGFASGVTSHKLAEVKRSALRELSDTAAGHRTCYRSTRRLDAAMPDRCTI
ncbi:hypothetical protein EVAR_46936_1 [Eumeta japonica]|uniref:Uncharacterized protein n=1 Tax=Eumeta variegata TaxID=151549 RepID=A0A4C2A2K0_EUMVA|nr:hypothetical protein EVAR_46936_1 [Eumeta japonica]